MMNNFLNGMFGKVGSGMCRLSMNGGIAVKTNGGYKTYNIKTGKLTNCSNFVFDIGEEFFFIIPTNKVEKGDIILVNGKPRCVIEADKTKITVINYEDSTIETVLPERHVFMESNGADDLFVYDRDFKPGDTVQHFKGGFYKIVAIGTNTGTEEKMVVYQSLKDKRVWIRPYEMFISKVDREKYPNADQSYRLIKVKITA